MNQVILEGFAIDEDVVKEYDYEFAKIRSESLIYRGLEGQRCIAQPKRHYAKLIMVVMGAEHCLANIFILYQNLMVTL